MNIQRWNKKEVLFDGVLDPVYKDLDFCHVYYVADKGYVVLNLQPSYGIYSRIGIAEIQDLYVLPNHRREGVATALIRFCEQQVTTDMVGISVPVSPQFGAAQRLYYRLGYEPDGNGVTYDREPIAHGSLVKLDDCLCLMMVKDLHTHKRKADTVTG
tara:strand:+ start:3185 stop:3655 length:471 start_codon:yes stop_codon:yes gene_type:complete